MSRPLIETLRHIAGGAFLDKASDELAELVAAVDLSGKPGKIDITVMVKKATKNGAMHIAGKIKTTKPAGEPMETLLFATPDGNLFPDNPHQIGLDLKVVAGISAQPESLKTVGEQNV